MSTFNFHGLELCKFKIEKPILNYVNKINKNIIIIGPSIKDQYSNRLRLKLIKNKIKDLDVEKCGQNKRNKNTMVLQEHKEILKEKRTDS